MKKISKHFCFFITLLCIITLHSPTWAGVEPSPFKQVVNKINAIENNLTAIDFIVEHELFKLVRNNKHSHLPKSIKNKLDAMAEKICMLRDKLDVELTELPDNAKGTPEITYALVDVELKAASIVNRINKLFLNDPEYIEIPPERVKDNSQSIVYIAEDYIRPISMCDSASEEEVTTLQTQSFTPGDVLIEVDEDGFLCDPERWNESVAEALAEEEDIEELTEEHWNVMNYLRDYYIKFGVAPMIRKLCKETGFKLKKIYDLFPSGPAKGACKLAGLPKPTGCV